MRSLIQQLKIDYRIRLGYGAAFVLLLLSYLLTWYANKQLVAQSKWVMNTNITISDLDNLLSELKDAETGIRGYVITKDQNFLEPYYSSMRGIDTLCKKLPSEIQDNAIQQRRFTTVKQLIAEKDRLNGIYVKYDPTDLSIGKDSAIKLLYTGKKIMDDLRFTIGLIKISEQKILQDRNAELKGHYSAMNVIIFISLLLAFLFAAFGFITYTRENIARKKAEAQLRNRIRELDEVNKQLIEMKGAEQFAATGRIARTIAHEVRNPLTNIDLATSQIRTEIQGDDNINMLFDMVGRNSKRINQLITDLLNATRFVDLAYERVAVNTLLDEALELAKDRIELNHVIVQKQYKTTKDISVDPGKIKIAFLNVIVNAIEAMNADEKILRIATLEKDNKCIIEISDNGIGMDATALAKLFEPYFTTKSKGNGLGLTNTQNIILNHHGTINAESTPGKGTKFIIKFDVIK
ncbi:sensor histidine kinase [Ferruginibacter albus]|uniref:sensor histidine kinase n=1 Tax=Ferruginibacter albus TaxID=2875540 RepID=UPI001CC4F3EA|nr:CHASE3 domain-containing protein [Ferruginibacter albus]UAY51971.1 CHASE3 domain-containing protein [Ferruginibacter albus]